MRKKNIMSEQLRDKIDSAGLIPFEIYKKLAEVLTPKSTEREIADAIKAECGENSLDHIVSQSAIKKFVREFRQQIDQMQQED